MAELDITQINKEITSVTNFWSRRNKKFKEWYEYLILIDKLASKGMESYVSNEPATFYQMAHYLLTKGEISHQIPIVAESASDLDLRARVHRGCQYMWQTIDRSRKLGGCQSYIDDLSFYLLVLGWYSTILAFDKDTGLLQTQIWNPADTYPRYVNNKLISCVHTYKVTQMEAMSKAEAKDWTYTPKYSGTPDETEVTLNDFFIKIGDTWSNMVIIDNQDVTGLVERPDVNILVAPVGGYSDRGSLTSSKVDWRSYAGKGIFEVNETVATSFNKWKSMISQVLRDTVQPITQEFSANPQATPEQLRKRGAHFHYAPGEGGLERLPPVSMPIELQSNLLEIRREMQKGSFNDAVYGMMEGQSGYSLSLLASSSANQILYPYMDSKHFVISEADKFWLDNLKSIKKTFQIKGRLLEQIKPEDIPEDVTVIVNSDVATPKDWLERGTIGGMLREDLDQDTLITEIYHLPDPQSIRRKKKMDMIMLHPTTINIEMIAGYNVHANYLESRGDRKQAELFRKAAASLEAQLGVPPAGSGNPAQANQVAAAVEAGTPAPVATIPSNVQSPEASAGGGMFTPQGLRRAIGKGTVKASNINSAQE